jgi:xylan 1,4-beta-xylosidase
VTLARSRCINGPYELHPDHYILTSRDHAEAPLQRAGHADLVDTPSGETYMIHLCGRPLPSRGRCTLGRETAIQKMIWKSDGWLYHTTGTPIPEVMVPAPALAPHPWETPASPRVTFDQSALPLEFQWLRSPYPGELFSLTERPGYLRLFGRETIGSLFRQSLVARRQQSHHCGAETALEFEPEHFQQMAGLVCYYNAAKFHYLYLCRDDVHGKHLRVMSALPDQPSADAFTAPIPVSFEGPVELRAEIRLDVLRFAWRSCGSQWNWLSQSFDASILSDEATGPGLPNFTGAFVGMACQDLSGSGHFADFAWFEYRQ